MITGSVMLGSGDASSIVFTPPPGMLKMIVFIPEISLASMIACRNEPAPESAVLSTESKLSVPGVIRCSSGSTQNCRATDDLEPRRQPRESPAYHGFGCI